MPNPLRSDFNLNTGGEPSLKIIEKSPVVLPKNVKSGNFTPKSDNNEFVIVTLPSSLLSPTLFGSNDFFQLPTIECLPTLTSPLTDKFLLSASRYKVCAKKSCPAIMRFEETDLSLADVEKEIRLFLSLFSNGKDSFVLARAIPFKFNDNNFSGI